MAPEDFLVDEELSRANLGKDKNGVVVTRTDDQLNRWKEYFQEVLNWPASGILRILLMEEQPLGIRTGHITMAEVNRALKSSEEQECC